LLDVTMTLARFFAAFLALLAAIGVGWQFQLNGTIDQPLPPLARAWDMLRYFTIITNLLVVVVLGRIAIGAPARTNAVATVTLSIIMVGVVYRLLLAPAEPKPAPDFYPDFLMHVAVPVLVPLWWLAFGPHDLRLRGLWVWLSLPMAYLAYAMLRGGVTGKYPYFFLDFSKTPAQVVLVYCAGLVAAFAAAGALLYLVSRLRERGRAPD
jgi:hypothetical protein